MKPTVESLGDLTLDDLDWLAVKLHKLISELMQDRDAEGGSDALATYLDSLLDQTLAEYLRRG